MIGNRHAWGRRGYTILEEGRIDPATLALQVDHYLVCRPDGEPLAQEFDSLEAARAAIDALEAGNG